MTRREMHDRLWAESNRLAEERREQRRAAQAMETHRPWLCDAEPGINDDPAAGGPRMLAHALLMCALVLVLVGLACRAYFIETRVSQRAYCAQLQMAQAPELPSYCGEGK